MVEAFQRQNLWNVFFSGGRGGPPLRVRGYGAIYVPALTGVRQSERFLRGFEFLAQVFDVLGEHEGAEGFRAPGLAGGD